MKKQQKMATIKKLIRDFKFRSMLHDNPDLERIAWNQCERLGLTWSEFEFFWENCSEYDPFWENC